MTWNCESTSAGYALMVARSYHWTLCDRIRVIASYAKIIHFLTFKWIPLCVGKFYYEITVDFFVTRNVLWNEMSVPLPQRPITLLWPSLLNIFKASVVSPQQPPPTLNCHHLMGHVTSVTWPLHSQRMVSYRRSVWCNRLSGAVVEIWSLKDFGVMTFELLGSATRNMWFPIGFQF